MIWLASVTVWIGLAATAPATQDATSADARAALERGEYAETESLLLRLPLLERGTLEARLWFEVGDFVRCTRVAREQLAVSGDAAERRELAWWGAKAALWLGDSAGARAWIDALVVESIGDETWSGVVNDYTARAVALESAAADARLRLGASRTIVLVSIVLIGLLGRRWLRHY